MEMISEYSPDEVEGKYWVDVFSPENGVNNFSDVTIPSKNPEVLAGNTSSIITKTGEKREIMWFDSILKDENGKTVGLMAVGQDITRQVKIQKKNFKVKTSEAIGNFLDDFAKELDEIAAVIHENISRFEMEIKADDKKAHYLETIKKAVDRAKELSDRVAHKSKKEKL
jgi:PAS domain S-box-containing protein